MIWSRAVRVNCSTTLNWSLINESRSSKLPPAENARPAPVSRTNESAAPSGKLTGVSPKSSRLASAPAARLWVPGSRNRADAFGPDADVRGPGDLPVLVLAGDLAAAIAGLTGDLADAVVDVGDPVDGEVRPVPLADRSVAVLNRGTPGCVVTPDGTLHLSLMRSCSAWPSCIWIDGDRRTAPDGSKTPQKFTAAADPPDEPPGVRDRSQGLLVVP